jgi:cytochrome c biogenesis protein CcmG, thiol:disulfide interchange protein DsbE
MTGLDRAGTELPEDAARTEHRPAGEPVGGLRWARWTAIAAAALVVAVAAMFGTRFGTDPSAVDSPLIGQPAPDIALPVLEGDGEVALADLRGDVVVVNFWASWCLPCRDEHPDLLSAAQAYEERGVRFLGIIHQDRPGDAIAFLDELGRGYPHVTDPGSRAAIEFGLFGIPETFVIDAEGNIAAKFFGTVDYPTLSETIEAVLAGEHPGSQPGGELWRGRDG